LSAAARFSAICSAVGSGWSSGVIIFNIWFYSIILYSINICEGILNLV
jgi:hypothetical protein